MHFLIMGETARVYEDGMAFIPSDVRVEARVVVGDMGGVSFLEEGVDRLDVGLELGEREWLDPFLDHKVDGREIDGMFDVEPVNESGKKRSRTWFEMEREERCLFREVIEGELVAGERSLEFAPFFLLVARFGEPRARHIFKEFQGVLAVFGKKDVRLAALILEKEPVLEIRCRIVLVLEP